MRRVFLLALAATLLGCSGMTTERVAMGAAASQGIPFTLNKPQMTVVRTPGKTGAPDSYAITTTYVPDPTQRFALQISPNLFSSVDWTMTFDTMGSLTDTNAKITNELPAVLKSLGTLAMTIAAADQTDVDETKTIASIREIMLSNLNSPAPYLYDEASDSLSPASKAVARGLVPAATKLLDRLDKAAMIGQAAQSFTYASPEEKELLITAARLILEKIPDFSDTASTCSTCNPLEQGLKSLDPQMRARASEIFAAYQVGDRIKLKAIKAAENQRRANTWAAFKMLPPSGQNEDQPIKDSILVDSMVNEALQELKTFSQAHLGDATLTTVKELAVLLPIIEASADNWRKNSFKIIDAQIQSRREALRLEAAQGQAPDETNDAPLIALQRRRAALLGVLPEYERRRRIEGLVTSQTSVGDYKALSDEIAFLDKKLTDAESALASATPDPVPDVPASAEFMVADSKFGTGDHGQWIAKKLANDWNRPAYVVVVEPPISPLAVSPVDAPPESLKEPDSNNSSQAIDPGKQVTIPGEKKEKK